MSKISFNNWLREKARVFDGAMGSALIEKGMKLGEGSELQSIQNPSWVIEIHKNHLMAGAEVITINTFGVNPIRYDNYKTYLAAAKSCADQAIKAFREESGSDRVIKVALDIGPLGELLFPLGKLDYETAFNAFKNIAVEGWSLGCDLAILETFTDLYELRCAVLALGEVPELPFVTTMSFETTGRTFFGTDVESMAVTLGDLGVSAIGFNCSFGIAEMLPLVEKLKHQTNLPIIVQPNAGIPEIIAQIAVYKTDFDQYTEHLYKLLEIGVSGIGGCCGSGIDHIEKIRKVVDRWTASGNVPIPTNVVEKTRVSSSSKSVTIGENTVIIGERINPTGKKRLKEAIRNLEFDYIVKEGILQVEQGADILDVNIGIPEIDEADLMKKAVLKLQGFVDVPLQIDSASATTLEVGARYYNGKPLINSVNGKEEVLTSVLPIVKKYGACVLGLTLDENGIPASSSERFEIAKKIVERAEAYGIPRHNVLIDCLTLTASAQQSEVIATLETVRRVKQELGVCTVLGVSNVSFGLPARELLNQSFLTMALAYGLDAPIMNPAHAPMIAAIKTFEVLANKDVGSKRYIDMYGQSSPQLILASKDSQIVQGSVQTLDKKISEVPLETPKDQLIDAIKKGQTTVAAELTRRLLTLMPAVEIVDEIIITALDDVGKRYEKGQIYLPQLIQSAEVVQAAFEVLKLALAESGEKGINKGKIVLATVKHDIHDIGKNIVKVVLENYGYEVFDLGRDVAPEKIVETCKQYDIKVVGLSALMTTTVASMRETIELLKASNLDVTVVVGGAVLSEEIAEQIGANFFAKDATEVVRIAERILG